MKKIIFVSIFSCLFLCISSILAYYLRFTNLNNELSLTGIGVGLLIISGITFLIFKKHLSCNIICFFVSGVALGFCIRAWYIFRGFDNSLLLMLFISLSSVIYLWVFYFLLYIPFIEKHIKAYFWIFFISSLIGYLLLVLLTKTTYVSTYGFYMIIEIAFVLALCNDTVNMKELIKQLTISSFSVFIVAIVILLIMADGDGFDITCDFLDVNLQSPKSKRINKRYY